MLISVWTSFGGLDIWRLFSTAATNPCSYNFSIDDFGKEIEGKMEEYPDSDVECCQKIKS